MRFYKALLHLYPEAFRNEYGEEMCRIFAQRAREAPGPWIITLWLTTALDVFFNATAVHWDVLRQDLRYTARTLARSPGFAITAILVMALGVGANTAAFTITDFVLIRPLPFREPDRLVKLWEHLPGYTEMELSPANYRDWKRMSKSFEAMAAYDTNQVNLVGQGDPQRLDTAAVTSDLLPLLGVPPLLGRWFTKDDEREGAPGTLLLSYRLWQAEFGGEAGVIGRKVNLDGAAFTVVGIMPPDFTFPDRETVLWNPRQFEPRDFEDRNDNYLEVVARLKPGVSIAQARAEMGVIAAQLERRFPKENARHGSTVIALRDELSRQSRLLLIALCGAAVCVLLIACANLANLLLARSLIRRKELAVRAALGAGRERLVRQFVTEALVLAALGGALGVLVAQVSVPLLARLVPNALPIAQAPSVDFRLLIFAGVVTALAGIGFGVVPALRFGNGAGFSGLREGSRSGGGQRERLRSVLVIAEVVASVVLLVSAGLLMRALLTVQATDPGFRPAGLMTLRTALPMPKYEKTAERDRFYNRVLSQVRQLPGVSNAAYVSYLPMTMTGGIWPVSVAGEMLDRAESHSASLRFVTPGFFDTMGIPLLLGRDVRESDTIDSPFVAVVSQSLARRHWPGQNPLGRHFQFAFHDRVVVGVVGDIRVRGLERSSEPQAYVPYKQTPDGALTGYSPKDLVARATTAPDLLLPRMRQIIREADRQQPVSDVRTMDEIIARQTAARSLQLRVLGIFAAMAFLLAGIGIHGLLSFAVSQRSQEIGVRMALGASSRNILGMVLREGVWLAMIGVALGVALAYATARGMEALLAGVKPGDSLTFLAASCLCLTMALLGSLLPALRAVRVDPISVMKSE